MEEQMVGNESLDSIVSIAGIEMEDIVEDIVKDDNENEDKKSGILSSGDLLDILMGDEDLNEEEAEEMRKGLSTKNNAISDSIENIGTGDVDDDLSNWLSGKDRIPSNKLTEGVANAESKLDTGIHWNILASVETMGKTRKFIEDCADIVFDAGSVASMSPDDVDRRMTLALNVWKTLAGVAQKSQTIIKDMRVKGMDKDHISGLQTLLTSVPEHRLKALLSELQNEK